MHLRWSWNEEENHVSALCILDYHSAKLINNICIFEANQVWKFTNDHLICTVWLYKQDKIKSNKILIIRKPNQTKTNTFRNKRTIGLFLGKVNIMFTILLTFVSFVNIFSTIHPLIITFSNQCVNFEMFIVLKLS